MPKYVLAIVAWLAFILQALAAERPNIILLLADDQRPDTIHALGNERIATPALDRLVAEGTTFTRAVTAYPICLQSRIELMTGCTIFRGERFAPSKPKPQGVVPWAQTLRDAGYHTHHIGKWHNAGQPSDWGYESASGL